MKFKILVIAVLLTLNANGQSVKLDDILKHAYSKTSDLSIINGKELNYVIPKYISIIDTVKSEDRTRSFNIKYYRNDMAFESHLRKVKILTVLSVYFNKIGNGVMEIILEISSTKDDQYFGPYKFFSFIDKRQLKLVYNNSKRVWEYNSIIKIFDEPRVGQG
ncbi:hypothetical protein [Pedobacter lusitanus]|uniref:hypothetical protein n=1 Tax=Pedobacter lusitanus TaxID=1503925 RepID=UPI00126A0945|nr:hypothetical protein [Pedobacter lusitanus]